MHFTHFDSSLHSHLSEYLYTPENLPISELSSHPEYNATVNCRALSLINIR